MRYHKDRKKRKKAATNSCLPPIFQIRGKESCKR